jgi:hypothetical protein
MNSPPEFDVEMIEDLTEAGEESQPRFLYFTRLDLEHVGVVAKFKYVDSSRKPADVYAVDEMIAPCGTCGRVFVLRKIGAPMFDDHGHRISNSHEVLIGRGGRRICDCKGFLMGHRCRHVRMCEAVIRNRWLPAASEELDVAIPGRKAHTENA